MFFPLASRPLFQKALSGVLIFQFACAPTLLIAAQRGAPTAGTATAVERDSWHVEFDRGSSTIVLWTGVKSLALPVSKEVTRVGQDDGTLYLFMPSRRGVDLVSKIELESAQLSGGTSASVGHKFLSLNNELPAGQIPTDFAVSQNGSVVNLMISVASGSGARVYPVVVQKDAGNDAYSATPDNRDDAQAAVALARAASTQNQVSGLHADKPISIMGNGKIALTRDPVTGGSLLLAFDPMGALVHEYGATNPLDLVYLRSHPLPDVIKELGPELLGETWIDTLGAPFASFRMIRSGVAPFILSLIQLRETLAVRKNLVLTHFNTSMGDRWTDQLLAWGRLSLLIDYWDQNLLNPKFDANSIKADPMIAKALANVDESEFFAWAKDTKIFSEDEIDQMRTESRLKTYGGRKWSATAVGLMTLYAIFKVRAAPSVAENPLTHAYAGLWAFGEKLLRMSGRTSAQLDAFRAWGAAKQLRFRARLLRNVEVHRHQVNLIGRLEKGMTKLSRRLQRADARGQIADEATQVAARKPTPIFDHTQPIESRARQVLDVWEQNFQNVQGSGKTGWLAGFNPSNTASALKRVTADAANLKVKEEILASEDALVKLKSQILTAEEKVAALKEGRQTRPLKELVKTDTGKALMGTNSATTINARAQAVTEGLQGLRSMAKEKELKAITQRIEAISSARVNQATSRLEAANEANRNLPQDDAAPFFQAWAKISAGYAYWYMPLKLRQRLGLESDFAKEWIRPDYLPAGPGQFVQFSVTGRNARDAILFGAADTSTELFTQYMARKDSKDPNERIWGSGDNFISLLSWNGKSYGPHFDLIEQEIGGLWGWSMSMPRVYASMTANITTTRGGALTYFGRELNGLKKSIPNFLARSYLENYIFWKSTGLVVMANYRKTHGLEGSVVADLLPEKVFGYDLGLKNECPRNTKCTEFYQKLTKRTAFWTIPERFAFSLIVSKLSVSPQYWMQREVNAALPALTGEASVGIGASRMFVSDLVHTLYGMLAMPYATSFGMARWNGVYYGFNNPDTIEAMRNLKIDGILSKIDAQGYTNLASWTEDEQIGFVQLMTLLALSKKAEMSPLPADATPEQAAAWTSSVYTELFGSAEKVKAAQENTSFRVQVLPPAFQRGADSQKSAYSEQAKKLNGMMSDFRKLATVLPLESAGNDELAVSVMEPSQLATVLGTTGEKLEVQQMDSLMQDMNHLNATISTALARMKNSQREVHDLHSSSLWLSTIDILMGGGTFALSRSSLAKEWGVGTRKFFTKVSFGSLIGLTPYGFWLGDQAEAQIRNATSNGMLLKDLQELLFAATEELTLQFAEIAFRQSHNTLLGTNFGEAIGSLENSRTKLEEYLTNVQGQAEDLLSTRKFRIPRIVVEYGAVAPAFTGGWLAIRHLLFRASEGIIAKRTDRYVPTLFVGSILGYFYMNSQESRLKKEIELTTEDFFIIYQSYLATVMELTMLKEAKAAVEAGKPLAPEQITQKIRDAIAQDNHLKASPKELQNAQGYKATASDFREHLLSLIEN